MMMPPACAECGEIGGHKEDCPVLAARRAYLEAHEEEIRQRTGRMAALGEAWIRWVQAAKAETEAEAELDALTEAELG